MPIYDYECRQCGYIWESFAHTEETLIDCVNPRCGGQAKRLMGVSRVNTTNQDSPWIRSVTEVVDKDSGSRHCQEFLKCPTRENYKAWMKGEGIRPLEANEKPERIDEAAYLKKATDYCYNKRRKREAINL